MFCNRCGEKCEGGVAQESGVLFCLACDNAANHSATVKASTPILSLDHTKNVCRWSILLGLLQGAAAICVDKDSLAGFSILNLLRSFAVTAVIMTVATAILAFPTAYLWRRFISPYRPPALPRPPKLALDAPAPQKEWVAYRDI